MKGISPVIRLLLLVSPLISFFAIAHAAAEIVSLDGGNWMIAPQAEVAAAGEQISTQGYSEGNGLQANVPGTVFESYVNAGIEMEPTYGDNIYKVDTTEYDRNFWYRRDFTIPASTGSSRIWPRLDGVNRDADVFVNGKNLGWQTYDCYFDTTGAYWGAKSACEPVHIYWNEDNDRLKRCACLRGLATIAG